MSKILILDLETTDFLQRGGKIVEVGIVELCLETGNRKILFDKVCREQDLTDEQIERSWIIKNSTLTADEIKAAPDLNEIMAEIQGIIHQYPLGATAFNNVFDFGFMEDRRFHFPKKLDCPMKLSTNICKLPNMNGYGGYKWPKVQEAYDFFFGKNDYVEQHRGADDAFHEAEIVYELFKMGVFQLK